MITVPFHTQFLPKCSQLPALVRGFSSDTFFLSLPELQLLLKSEILHHIGNDPGRKYNQLISNLQPDSLLINVKTNSSFPPFFSNPHPETKLFSDFDIQYKNYIINVGAKKLGNVPSLPCKRVSQEIVVPSNLFS